MAQTPNSQVSRETEPARPDNPSGPAASEDASDSDCESIFAFRAPRVVHAPTGLEASQHMPFVTKRPTPANAHTPPTPGTAWPAEDVTGTPGDSLSSPAGETGESDSEDANSTTDNGGPSIIEAFVASGAPFNPQISPVLISIKDDIVDRISLKLQSITVHPGQHGARQHPYSGSVSSASELQGAGSWRGIGASRGSRRRRADEDDDISGRDNSDDQERNSRASALGPGGQKFACPFFKRYPESDKLGRRCYGPGWPTVHRVKSVLLLLLFLLFFSLCLMEVLGGRTRPGLC